MTGSLFSLPGTQYINVEHIHLVQERESQLPKDRRPIIQQGLAASLFLPLFLFSGNFWLQMTFRGEQTHFIGGPGAYRPATGRQDPVAPPLGDRVLSPSSRATGPWPPYKMSLLPPEGHLEPEIFRKKKEGQEK